MLAFQKVVLKHFRLAAGETRDRSADIMSVMVEKFTDLTDVVDRGMRNLEDKMDGESFATPSGSGSRPRHPQNGANATPRRPDRIQKRSRCPFCSRAECADPTQCALRIKWGSRMAIYKKKRLCPSKTCYKSHGGKCLKADEAKCDFCSRKHMSIWCIFRARDEGML